MDGMARHWAVSIPERRWATERLFHHDTLTVPDPGGIAPDDDVLLVADGRVVALTRAGKTDGDELMLTYRRRAFDAPVPAAGLSPAGAVTPVDPATFGRLAGALGAGRDRTWLVSVALPIEADTPAEAVRRFWSHVLELGPAELPAYVWPSGDELAMQAFVLGAEANQDPEEDDD
jgi:hypothetical protein